MPFSAQLAIMAGSLFGGADEKAPVSMQIKTWEAPEGYTY